MKYRKFGNTDLMVSEIGFGAWAIGGNAMVGNIPIGWGKTDDTVSLAVIIPRIRTAQHAIDNTTGIVQLSTDDVNLIERAFTTHFAALVELMEQPG